MDPLDAILEIFAWIGLGAGVALALVALILKIADGTWIPTTAFLESGPHGRVARWFDADGGVGQAVLTPEQLRVVGDAEKAEVFHRPGVTDRMRLTPAAPHVRATVRLAAGLGGLGVVATIAAWVLLFVRG